MKRFEKRIAKKEMDEIRINRSQKKEMDEIRIKR